ncbi:cytochrome c oxidase cbb3-type subunit 4 [Devosia lucknowensis]|uniref:Cytochrome c oxidase cbb3-type subunit 4 n=1 Tax=Devosia lucknowensis TaxID=1096929 RepID=A0A1Y6F1D1_9HYPH|nr:cbb3-type cytochrome c oxidase subunit 3 [Devosia lucknowensis]SMQ68698.1 cytochrome c oxidase cbb3-type subunit 4 [Devosia lucknowensis]
MPFDHDTVVGFSKSFGLIYLVVLSIICLAWTYWPSNKKGFDEAARMPVLDEEDRPWR